MGGKRALQGQASKTSDAETKGLREPGNAMTERENPVIIGIVGDSGAGKTTLAAGVAEVLGPERTVNICIDDYHRYDRAARAQNGLTPHDPACNYLDILVQHVTLLRDGQPILKPVYNHNGGVLEAPQYVEPKPFIILEGLLGYATPELRNVYDVKFYLEPEVGLRRRWKLQRDTSHGGYTPLQVEAAMARLRADSERYVIPQRRHADMVVSFYPPDRHPEDTGEHLNCAHILRPTLPHLDLTPVLEQAKDNGGLVLELARDVDGRPVDVLHVMSNLANGDANLLESSLWGLIPHAASGHKRIGAFRDANDTVCYGRALALSQLLITHYLLTAADANHVS